MRVYWNWKLKRFVAVSAFAAGSIVGTSTQAQFREITPNQPQNVINTDELQETRERFVPPKNSTADKTKQLEPVPQALTGEPTLAVPQKVDPAPAAKPVPKIASKSAQKTSPQQTAPAQNPVKPTASAPTTAAKQTPDAQPSSPSDIDLENLNPFSLFGPPENAPDAPAPSDGDTYSLVFNGVQPGTTIADLRELWGEPAKIVEVSGAEKLIYKAPGFRQVDVLADGTHADDSQLNVQSFVIHLQNPEDAVDLATQLNLNDVIPCIVEDAKGDPLGVAFPERGVMFGLADDHESVTTISVEAINGDLFRLRAEADDLNNYVQSLRDLDTAVKLNDKDAHAFWLKSELLSQIGQPDAAYDAAVAAVSRSEEPLYRVTKARLLAEQGNLGRAKRDMSAIASDSSVQEIVRARAFLDWGNLQATGAEADFEASIGAHTKAIDLAANHLNSKNAKIRRMSKDILVDAHLAVAKDIALGNFQRQEEVVPKWLVRATELAENLLEKDRGEDTLRMEIYRATLAAYSVLPGNFDASIAADEALEEGKRLISESHDELYQRRVQRELIESLFYAARIEHQHGRFENAQTYADNATAIIDLDNEGTTTFDRYVAGQLYFLKGSLHAIHKQDHDEAVVWYDKARPILEDKSLDSLVNRNAFAELFVSMGVSYWTAGQKDTAIELTDMGTKMLQTAVQEGSVPLEVLSVPYGNLASMHASLGNSQEAKHFGEMMAKVDSELKRR